MSARERAATRAPTITPTSWPELAPGCAGRGVGAMVVHVVGGGVDALVKGGTDGGVLVSRNSR